MPGLAAIYCRISNDREGRELGVERQEDDCRALAQRLRLDVADVFIDNDISASTRSRKKRPAFEQLMSRAEAGEFAAILAYSNSRLTRRPMEYERLIRLVEQHRTRIATAVSGEVDLSNADGRALGRTMAAWDAAEAERTGERVARAGRQRAESGEFWGGHRPFGYEQSGLGLRSGEAAELAAAYQQVLAGVPLSAITRDMNARGLTTAGGGPWVYSSLRRTLLNPRNAGLVKHRGEVLGPAKWPAVVSEDTWRATVTLLSDPARRTTTGNRASYLLSGLAVCGGCGGSITSGGVKRSSGGAVGWRRIYVCRAHKCVGRRQDWVDEFVSEVIVERLSRPDAADLLVDQDAPDFAVVRAEISALRVRLDGLADAYAVGEIDRDQMRTGTVRLRARLDGLEATQAHVSRAPVLAELVGVPDVRAAWDALNLDRQRAVVEILMTVTLHPGGGGRRTFDPNKVEITWKV